MRVGSDTVTPAKVGPYRVEERLGKGGMGEVYRGFDERLERPVALKHVVTDLRGSSVALERLRREAKSIARFNHPAIVQIHDWVETDDGCWYVMELVEGRTLKQVIGGQPLPADQIITIAIAIVEGLAAAHDAGILHRDLKAENVMIGDHGVVKLLDFGLAKSLHKGQEDLTLTSAGKIIGTVSAMSPEQASGDVLDERSDLFSFGILLYEAATGVSPFLRDTAMQTLASICNRTQTAAIERNAALPPELSELIDHLLEKEPSRRPENAREVLARLQPMAPGGATTTGTVPRTATPSTAGGVARGAPASVVTADRRSRSIESAPTTDLPSRTAATRQRSRTSSRTSSGVTTERRQITVLSAAVVAAGGGALDSEVLYELLPELEGLADEIAARWESYLEESLGHRLVMCFGYPTAREDETRRAVRAALELIERVEQLGRELSQPLSARVGLATGLVVAAKDGPEDRLILGRTLDLANGLQGAAESGSVMLGAMTHGLVERFFDCRKEQPIQLPGARETQAMFRVLAIRGDTTADHDLELVGRREELDLLLGRCRLAKAGEGQVVLLSGAAGIGKSRLVRELEASVEPAEVVTWKLYGSPDDRGSPLRPLLEALRRNLELDAGGVGPDAAPARLEAFLKRFDLDLDEHVPVLATLLTLPLPMGYREPDLGPRRFQAKIQEVVLSLLLATAEDRLLLLIVEDLQWLDPSTLELLGVLIEDASTLPVLAVLTSRPEFESPWRQARLTRLALGRFEQSDTDRLIARVAGGREISPQVRAVIAAKTDGVPLFVEELTKSLLETESSPDQPSLPATLRDSLSARLDRVGPARRIAQVAAVLGRDFTFPQLAAVADLEDAELRDLLDDLGRAELVLRKGYGARRIYFFKHALIQEAAYDSLLASERRRIHGRIGSALEGMPEISERQPERLARHLEQAGETARAVGWWLAAGDQAISSSAHREGMVHLERGLELIRGLPPGPERTPLELALLTKLGAAAGVLYGYSAPEVEGYWRQARDLCRGLDDDPRLFWVLWGLWSFNLVRSKIEVALSLGRRLLRIADAADDGYLRLVALGALGQTHYFRGELEPAIRLLERAATLDDPERDQAVASVTGQDVGVMILVNRGLLLWHLGDGAGAVRSSAAAVALAERIEHSYSLAFAHVFAARLHQSRRDVEAVAEHAAAVVELSEEKGFFWINQGKFFLGCQANEQAVQSQGQTTELLLDAQRLMAESLDAYRAAGARLSLTYMLAQLVETHLRAGALDDARAGLDQANEVMESGAERYWEPELLRFEGELSAARGEPKVAEKTLRRALALARKRRDRAFELRAALSLAPRLAARGRKREARKIVVQATGAISDPGSPDLRAAQRFLEGRT